MIERKNPMFKRHTNTDLIYLSQSPDYCEADHERGILGTHNRPCNNSASSLDSCDLM